MAVWQRNLRRLLGQKEVLILHGNVRDTAYSGDGGELIKGLSELLRRTCRELGLNRIHSYGVFRDAVQMPHTPMWSLERIEGLSAGEPTSAREVPGQEKEATVLTRWLKEDIQNTTRRTAFVIHYVDKLTPYSQRGIYPQHIALLITLIEKLIENIPPNNRLILVALQDTMVPVEYYTNSPKTAVLEIPQPDKEERRMYWGQVLHALRSDQLDHLSDITDGLYFRDLQNIGDALLDELQMAKGQLSSAQLRKLVNLHRLGVAEDPWAKLPLTSSADAQERRGLLDGAEEWFKERVIGQDFAVRAVVNSIKQARAGIARLASGQTFKPQAILFFAGPTGVGKTFLGQNLAEYLFGTDQAFIQVDMSEFREEHTVSKLIGAPPGYIGFENGGKLTNAVKARPFSVILFDEIEKAHPKILPIFLQMLDQGRLTDSRGQTVYFTESVVIFTSNIGTRTHNSRGQECDERRRLDAILADSSRSAEQRANDVREHFVSAVREFFMYEISLPELLNRIGSQIIAFNYINQDDSKRRIVQAKLEDIAGNFRDRFHSLGHTLSSSPAVSDYFLQKHRKALEVFGGRGLVDAIQHETCHLLAQQVLVAEKLAMASQNFVLDVQDGHLTCCRGGR